MRRVSKPTQGAFRPINADHSGGIGRAAGGDLPLPDMITRENARTQERYLEFFAVTIRNAHTRRAYMTAATRFFAFCDDRGLELSQVTPMLVAGYIESHPGEALTVRLHLAALRRLFDWLVTGGILPYSPVTSVRGPKLARKVGTTPVMTAGGVDAVIAGTDSPTLAGLRDRALLLVMLMSFARIGALLALTRSNYQKAEGTPRLQLKEKGSQERTLPLPKEAAAALDSWLIGAGPALPSSPLFPAIDPLSNKATTRPLSARMALKRVKRAAARAGESSDLCNHSFRATGITLFRQAGGSLDRAQAIAGHASSETTRLYDRSDEQLNADELDLRFARPSSPYNPVAREEQLGNTSQDAKV